jgi:DNA-binding CsgD family transcriptional regulator/tetratricopeptide (TPR) repeat protein
MELQESPLRLATPDIVGRDGELAFLRAALAETRHGRGSAVFVVGEPGLGKTRLVREVARVADAAGQTVLRGRATSRSAQFRPLTEALSALLRHRGVPQTPELAPYLPALSRLVPEWRAHRLPGADDSVVVLAEAVLRLLRWLGTGHGCLLALDDLHEADADTLAVVDYLADNLAGEPVVLVGTTRPDPGPAIDLVRAARRRGVAAATELSHLDDAQVRLLVAGCLGLDAGHPSVAALTRLVDDGEGNPFYVEELLAELVGRGALARRSTSITASRDRRGVPPAVLASVTARVARLGPAGPAVLRAAAMFGQRFPAPLARAVAGVEDRVLVDVLRAAVDARLVDVDDDGYAFRHALTVDALRERLLPQERAALAAGAARAIETAHPDLPGEWCLTAGELWELAGDTGRAAELLGRAGRRAVADGGLRTAIALLERGLDLLADGGSTLRADRVAILEALLDALVAAGQVVRATELGARFDVDAEPEVQAMVHLRLARAATAAGQWTVGSRELDLARKLMDHGGDPADTAPVDVVAAQLAFTDPEPGRLAQAEELAGRALAGATATGLPEIACEALEVLGTCARVRDLDEAESLFRRALDIADRHALVVWRIRLLFHLGAQTGIRTGDPAGLVEARAAADAAGALVTALDIVSEMAVVQLIRGEYAAAERGARESEETARRLRLGELRVIALGLRVCVSAHQGKRAEAAALFTAFERHGGADSDIASAVWGFGLVFCSLLEEDRPRALSECARAVAAEESRPPQYVSYAHGPGLFLAVLDGSAGRPEVGAVRDSATGKARWNDQFVSLAEAVLVARDGHTDDAVAAVARFEAAAEPFPLAHHLGLRLIAEVALDGGWGEPARWLRAAEVYFHALPAPRVVAAIRVLLRKAGMPVRQRRRGADGVPVSLRLAGVTVREYEVLKLVADRLTNREISERLFVSRRTVDTHVANLLAKLGRPDRVALAHHARELEQGDFR